MLRIPRIKVSLFGTVLYDRPPVLKKTELIGREVCYNNHIYVVIGSDEAGMLTISAGDIILQIWQAAIDGLVEEFDAERQAS